MSEAYERPDSLDAALGLLAQGEWTVIAGGTDVYPMATDAHAWGGEGPRRLLDVTDIGEMRGIETRPDGHRIGGRVTWSDIVRADLPDYFDGLRLAAREVGGVQIQNRGTVAGNICNASPAADGVPPLLSLDAIVDIAGADGTRVDSVVAPEVVARAPGRVDIALADANRNVTLHPTAALLEDGAMNHFLTRSHHLPLAQRRTCGHSEFSSWSLCVF